MRILWWSNAPWIATGYGKQTREIATRLRALGNDVAIAVTGGLMKNAIDWNGITVYPALRHPLGVDTIRAYAEHFYADVVISLYDVWAFPPDIAQKMLAPWVAWTPIDGAPVPQSVIDRLTVRRPNPIYALSMSQFGKRQLEEVGIGNTYIPLGVDCSVFVPADRDKQKIALGIPPDNYLVTMVAANKGLPPRKSWQECLTAFSIFERNHPEALLYLHTTRKPIIREGVDLPALIRHLGIKRVIFADEIEMIVGVGDGQMATIYQASDVLLSPSMAEGFGLPIAEAQACGCPVITQVCSSMPELTVNGYCVDPLRALWMPPLSYWWHEADVQEIALALEMSYNLDDDGKRDRSSVGIDFVRRNFDWAIVMRRHWVPFLEKLEAELW